MTSTADPSGLWALGPVSAKPLDGRNILLLRRDNGAVAAVDAQWQPFLQKLQAFRTLQGHAQAVANAVPSLKGREHLLVSGLRALLDSGVFISAEAWLQPLEAGNAPAEHRGPITVVVTTCDRPECLERLLKSLGENRARFGGDWTCEVIDDSRDDHCRQRNADLVRAAARQFPVTCFGRDEQQAFIDLLSAQVEGAAEHLPWLLESRHPDHQGAATYGIPVNLAFLRHAGSRIVLVDDDTVASAWVRPDLNGGVRFDNDTEMPWVLSSIEEAGSRLRPFGADPLAAHGDVLGAGLGRVLDDPSGPGLRGASLDGAEYKIVARLGPAARVRYTQNGLLGDPGTVSDLLLFMPGSRFLEVGATDEKRYGAFRQSPRCVFSGQRWPALRSTVKFQRATFAGIDLDPYMGPVLPAGRGEDSMIGAMATFLYPRDFGYRFSFALEHRPHEPRKWAIAPQTLAYRPSAIEMATSSMTATVLPFDFDPSGKMAVYAETLRSVIDRDGGVEIVNRINARYREILADNVGALNHALANSPKACRSWRADVTEVVKFATDRLRGPLPGRDAATDRELGRVARYASAIPAWSRAFAFCREKRSTSA